jgi:hypothetical protein
VLGGAGHGSGSPRLTRRPRGANPARAWQLGALAAACLLAAAPARAQLAVNAGVSLGGTNNATSEAEVTGRTSTQEADAFTRVQLGGNYTINGARLTQDLSYTFASYFYVRGDQSFSFDNDLTYSGNYVTSPDTALGYHLGASQGRTSDFDLLAREGRTGSRLLPTGSQTYVSGFVGQDFHLGLGPDWSIGQRLNGEGYTPIGDEDSGQPWTVGADVGLDLNRIWDQDTATLFTRAGHGRMGSQRVELEQNVPVGVEVEPIFGTIPRRQVNFAEAGLAWSHSYNEDWSHTVGVGGTGVQVPKTADYPNPPDPFADVSVHGSVHYLTPTGGELTLTLERAVHTNVFVGDVYLQNAIGLHGAHPFGYKEAWQVGGSIDYQRSQSVFVVDTKDSGIQIFSVSGTATWDWSKHRRVAFEIEYAYEDSKGGVTQLSPMSAGMTPPTAMTVQPFTLHRVMLLATLEWLYPQPERLRRERRRGGRGGTNEGAERAIGGDSGDTGGGTGDTGGGGDTDAGGGSGDSGGSERAEPAGASARTRARSSDRSGERSGERDSERASEGPTRGDGARP